MAREGKYVYCIIAGNEGRNFGPTGIGKRGDIVSTIGFNDISAVISSTPVTKYVIDPDNLTAHEKVIEEVMKDYTVLPVRFCTIADSTEEVRTFLRKRYGDFKGMLRDMDNKVELGLKGRWMNMQRIFAEIAEQDPRVKESERIAEERPGDHGTGEKIALGKTVKASLEEKKAREGKKILNRFKRVAVDIRKNDLIGDDMFLNAVFLIDRTREKQFDYLVEDLAENNKDRATFKYIGPAPPFNFVNIVVKW
ncbi:MAG: GvpL/GvpF family gas vesicle protein [Pseudomonadota bacterium]